MGRRKITEMVEKMIGTVPPKPRAKHHNYNDFPHYSSSRAGHCICLDECCQHYYYGCVCMTCPCRLGISHGSTLTEELDELLKNLEQKRKERKRDSV